MPVMIYKADKSHAHAASVGEELRMELAIRTEHLTKIYGQKLIAINDMNLEVPRGSVGIAASLSGAGGGLRQVVRAQRRWRPFSSRLSAHKPKVSGQPAAHRIPGPSRQIVSAAQPVSQAEDIRAASRRGIAWGH